MPEAVRHTKCLGREVKGATGSFGSVFRIEYQCSIKAAKVADTALTHKPTHSDIHINARAFLNTSRHLLQMYKCPCTHARTPTRTHTWHQGDRHVARHRKGAQPDVADEQ